MAEQKSRKPRADAAKNRDLLVAAAKEVLGQGGPNASLEAVAREAGVGIGTLYRHFPTREALFHAVFGREVEQLVTALESLETAVEPVEALRGWLHSNVAVVETKRGLLGALSLVMTEESKQTYADVFGRMTAAINQLLQRAVEAGQIRSGVTADDLLQTMYVL